ncbi:protein LOW PSII ACCUMULATION 1, chloroplastic-like [Papaver somniferum]|uniref:protein LOW PSII ACCUMULATION 1, chloroplastic-like n=1 Tax=Papaver somniferum TaxID=3469 RepID=UPI000E6F4753|nr:protein LOW PSII ACCUMULATION 1, chloroplastic-like [Papaver somniferum]
MASASQVCCIISCPNQHKKNLSFSRQILSFSNSVSSISATIHRFPKKSLRINYISVIKCSASNKPEISSIAKIRSEVLSPFRSVRMFFYLAFIASASLGGLIATTQLIGTLSRSGNVEEILKGLGIDIGAVVIFAFLYSRDNKSRNAQLARLSREESLANLKLRVDEKRVIPISSLRGFARIVILAGPVEYIMESFSRSKSFTEALVERGVLVVPFPTDGSLPQFEFDDEVDLKTRKRLWQLVPLLTSEWSSWLDEQKKMANISPDSPVYISLRMDGRVRGSGVGYPPWNAFVAQLPVVKGMWGGVLDGMDGRV